MDTPTTQEQSFMQRMESFFAKFAAVPTAPTPAEDPNAIALAQLQADIAALTTTNAAAQVRIDELEVLNAAAQVRIDELAAIPAASHTTVVADQVSTPADAKSYHMSPLTLKARAIEQRNQLALPIN